MSVSLSAERDRIQRQVEQLEQSLSATHPELQLLSSETDDELNGDDAEEERQCAAGLLAQREKIQNEIHNLEEVLGPHPVCVSDADDSSSSEESELGLSPSADSCLQMNLVYQHVVQETLDQLETLLTHNHRQQKELVTQLSGPIRESSRERPAHPSCQLPINMYLGRFLKPYFKDKLTGLGPPANQETKEKASRMTGCLDDKKLKVKRWESWQKTLLIHSVTRDSLRRLIQPKLSKVDYLSQKLSRATETDKLQLREQISTLERDIELLRTKKDHELVGGRYDEHDWPKISNIDFEGTREAEDISSFWQNFLHPSISKGKWSQDEVQQLKDVSRRHGERHWDAIATELGTGRTAFLCLQTFQRFVSDSLKRGVWTPDEDDLLRELVDKMRIGNFIPYTQMSYFMEGRDPAQLIYRWNQVLDPSLKKGSWTKEEDQLLLRAVSLFGEKDWWKIRFEVPGRTDCSCRDRYYDCLKVETKRGRFDQQEKQLLQLLVEKHGVGRWAKIASEIPHRYDAQCLREWRIMSRPARPPRPQKAKTTRKTPGGKKKMKEVTPPAKKRKRRRVAVKEESSEEEGEEEVQYMDSDEEKKTKIKEEVVQSTEEEEEPQEEEYFLPCMQDWVPAEKAHGFTVLSFRPVELPSSSGLAQDQTPVRSTIVGPFGRSVVLGPEPRELPRTERRGSVMMMVSPDQLRVHLHHQVSKYSTRGTAAPRKIHTDRHSPLSRAATDPGLVYELQAAVTPWIGNVLIPQEHRAVAAEALGARGAGLISTTPVFLLLLQTMSVDTAGCKDVIQQRRNRVLVLEPPAPAPVPSSRLHNSVAELLRQKRLLKEEQILNQLLQQPPLPPAPLPRPGVLQMPPIISPRMSSVSFPRAVFIPHPVSQPHSSSIGLANSYRPLPVGVLTSVVPGTLKAKFTCPAASRQKALPLTQNLMVALPSANPDPAPANPGPAPANPGPALTNPGPAPANPGPALTNPGPAPSPSSLISRSPKGRGQKVAEDQRGGAVGGTNDGVGGACADVGGARDGLLAESSGRRLRKPSLKAREADANKKAASSPSKRTQIQTSVQPLPQSPFMPTPQQLASSAPTVLNDHHYASFRPRPDFVGSDPLAPPPDSAHSVPPKAPRCRRTRAKGKEQPDQCVGGAGPGPGPGAIEKGKKVQNPTQRARPLQESKAETRKKKRTSSSSPLKKRSRSSFPKREVVIRKQPMAAPRGFCLLPGQSMWVMTPGGLVQLAQAPPQGLQLTLVPSAPLPAQPGYVLPSRPVCPSTAVSVPVNPVTAPRPPSKPFTPYKGALRAELAPPPALQFDPSLMFFEPREAVCDWLSGRGGVAVPGAAAALPYLPPFVGSLNTLSALLRSKTSLTKCSLKLLARGSEPQRPPTKPGSPSKRASSQPQALPDSTSDLGPPRHTPAPSVSPQEEEELVEVLRQLVAERFSGNPAYQLLKARFLSCFTVPALLATVQPIKEKSVTCTTNEEEEEAEREREELKKIKERGRQRRAERSVLLCDGSGTPANHFSGIHSAAAPLSC